MLGFSSKDIKFGLWRKGPLAFVVEYLFYVIIAIIIIPVSSLLLILLLGAVFHLININSFFGFKDEDIAGGSSKKYAIIVLIAFTVFIILAQIILS